MVGGSPYIREQLLKSVLKDKKIFVDPGHGGTLTEGRNRCGSSYKFGTTGKLSGTEKDSVLVIGIRLKQALEYFGVIANISRTTDTPVCLGERAELANDWEADVLISLHHNGSDNPDANGISAHWTKTDDKTLAEKMAPNIKLWSGLNTWGQTGVREQNLQVLRDSDMPAVLLELGFMTNPTDDEFISTFSGKNKFIDGILDGLFYYFS